MDWVLIVLLVTSQGPAMHSTPMKSEKVCKEAGKELTDQMLGLYGTEGIKYKLVWVCKPKGQGGQ